MIKYLASVGRDCIIKRMKATKAEGAEGSRGRAKKIVTKYTYMKALHKEVLHNSQSRETYA